MKIWGTLFYTKYRFNERGVRIGCNYSCCNLERGPTRLRERKSFISFLPSIPGMEKGKWDRNENIFRTRQLFKSSRTRSKISELVKLYSKCILDLGMHKVPALSSPLCFTSAKCNERMSRNQSANNKLTGWLEVVTSFKNVVAICSGLLRVTMLNSQSVQPFSLCLLPFLLQSNVENN